METVCANNGDPKVGDRERIVPPQPTGNPEIHDYGKVDSVVISAQHAQSLAAMVQWFKELTEKGMMMQEPGRSDELTIGYCDELLEDLGQ